MCVSRESRTGLTSGVVNVPLILAYLPLGLGLGLGLKPDGLTGGGWAGRVVTGVLVLGAVILFVLVVACSRRSIPFGDFGTTLLIVLGAVSVVLRIVLGSEHRFPTQPSARFSLSPRGIRGITAGSILLVAGFTLVVICLQVRSDPLQLSVATEFVFWAISATIGIACGGVALAVALAFGTEHGGRSIGSSLPVSDCS
jgi:hypothetical protein